MAKKSGGIHGVKLQKVKVKRKGIHAKSKTSVHKGSKLYKKLSVGQGG